MNFKKKKKKVPQALTKPEKGPAPECPLCGSLLDGCGSAVFLHQLSQGAEGLWNCSGPLQRSSSASDACRGQSESLSLLKEHREPSQHLACQGKPLTFSQTPNVLLNLWTLELMTDRVAAVNLLLVFTWAGVQAVTRPAAGEPPRSRVNRYLADPRGSATLGLVQPTDGVSGHRPGPNSESPSNIRLG